MLSTVPGWSGHTIRTGAAIVIRVEVVTVCLAFEPYNVVRTILSPSSLILHPLGIH